jgi:hypothetical protein
VHDDVARADQPSDDVGRYRVAQVDRQRTFAALTSGELVDSAALFTPWWLDFDDVGSQVGEALGTQRAGDVRPEVQNPDAGKWRM